MYTGYFALLSILRVAGNQLTIWFKSDQHFWPEPLTRIYFVKHCIILYLHYTSRYLTELQRLRKACNRCVVLTCYKITSLNCWVENYWSSLRLNTKKAHISHSLISLLFKDLLHFAPGLQRYQCGAVCILTFLLTGMYAQQSIKKIFFCVSKMSFSSPSQETLNMLPKVHDDAQCSRTPYITESNILSINIYIFHIHQAWTVCTILWNVPAPNTAQREKVTDFL